jgi:hypothetical protein
LQRRIQENDKQQREPTDKRRALLHQRLSVSLANSNKKNASECFGERRRML